MAVKYLTKNCFFINMEKSFCFEWLFIFEFYKKTYKNIFW